MSLTALASSLVGDDVTADRIHVGIGGVFKVGRWTAARVVLGSAPPGRAHVEVDAPDPEGSPVTYRSEPVELRQSGPNVLSVLFKMGRLEGTLRVRVLAGEKVLLSRQLRASSDSDTELLPPMRQSVFLIGHVHTGNAPQAEPFRLGPLIIPADEITPAARSGSMSPPKIDVIDLDSYDFLPTNSAAYSSIDVLFLTGRLDVDPAHSRAIEQWVRSGGHLVLTVGKEGANFSKSPLAAWLPVKIERTIQLRDLSPIEAFCRQSARIMSANDEPVDGSRLSTTDSKVLVSSLDGPLLCRSSYGLGRVTVFGIDINASPLERWNSAPDLLHQLVDYDVHRSNRSQPIATRLTQTGITELATQLDASHDEFPSVARVTMWPVMGLLVALLLLFGPIDFLLVHRILKRPELTWLTFPLFAILAAVSAVVWGASAKGDRLLLNQVDIVDVDAASGSTQSQSYGLIYSPGNERLDVSGDPDGIIPAIASSESDPSTLRIAWHGKAEATFGGMYRAGGAEIARAAYSEQPNSRGLHELPVAVWSTKSLESEWEGRAANLVESQLTSRGPAHLGGSFRHHFPEPIEDWIVAYGHMVFRSHVNPDTEKTTPIAPNVPWSTQMASQRELSGFLTGTTQKYVKSPTTKFEEIKIENSEYDPLKRNPIDVIRMLSFHRAAGGTFYTGLGNGALRKLDWTPFLDLNRAVLVGRIRRPMMHWQINQHAIQPEENVTIIRLLLPVSASREAREE